MFDDEERHEFEEIRRQCEERLDRASKGPRRHDTRVAILSLLDGDGGRVEWTEEEIRAGLVNLLPAKRRRGRYYVHYHLEVLCRSLLIVKTDDEPPRYKRRPLIR